MISYNELYELLRKEKYSETLQLLPKQFISEFKEYLNDKKEIISTDSNFFSDSVMKTKKQIENAASIFREIMLKRKKKILNLVLVAAETGIMKRDYENMLSNEQEVFDKLVKTFEESDKKISFLLNEKGHEEKEKNKMIIFKEEVEKFVDHSGKTIGPFKPGELANLDSEVASILVAEKKANFVDEE